MFRFGNLLSMKRLREGLSKTRDRVSKLFGRSVIDDDWFDEVETALIQADVGGRLSGSIVEKLRASLRKDPVDQAQDPDGLRQRLVGLLAEAMAPLAPPPESVRPLGRRPDGMPTILLIAGVNGAGKTTTLGKLSHHFQSEGETVLLAAGDTFRAAAREQLAVWGGRNGVEVIAQEGGDPAAVAFDAIKSGIARKMGVVMVDTAGRLPSQTHLMEELKKIRRTMAKAHPEAPHEAWLVLDGGTGQNAIAQAKAFDDAIGLTGLVITKLDGTARGGVLLALAAERPIPVFFIGVGERLEDLQPFDPKAFADALI